MRAGGVYHPAYYFCTVATGKRADLVNKVFPKFDVGPDLAYKEYRFERQ